jgi:two-component system, chemotaxis family, chemotaxis protein CheY
MLKAVIIDGSALARDLLNGIITSAGYEIVGQSHTSTQGYALVQKYRPHFVCVALEQAEDGNRILEQLHEHYPKTLVFLVSGTIDAATVESALARGVHGFIVKPFKADAVIRTIKSTILNFVKKQQAG